VTRPSKQNDDYVSTTPVVDSDQVRLASTLTPDSTLDVGPHQPRLLTGTP